MELILMNLSNLIVDHSFFCMNKITKHSINLMY